MWKSLRHPNVVSLLGITMGNGQFAMVSEWMTNGNINEFVRVRKDANRFELVRSCPSLLTAIVTDNPPDSSKTSLGG